MWELWRALDLEVDLPDEQERLAEALRGAHVVGGAVATVYLAQLCELMHPGVLQPETRGRYFVVISLLEAESLRAVMHARQGLPFAPSTSEGANAPSTVALHLLSRSGE